MTMLNNLYTSTNMIKQAMPFVPLADKTGLNALRTNIPSKSDSQRRFESEYVHPILGNLEPYRKRYANGTLPNNMFQKEVPMREAYDKIIQAQGFRHNDITRDPNYINKLNSYRSSPNSQLQPIPESIKFSYAPERLDEPAYNVPTRTVYSSPLNQNMMSKMRIPLLGDLNGFNDYFNNNYDYYDQNDYNNTQTHVIAHEAIGHAGNMAALDSQFYKPIAEREGKPVNEIRTSFQQKFLPTYWSDQAAQGNGLYEFTQSLHAAKRQGREWGYPVDSDNNEEVTQAFRDTINRLQKMPIEQARQLPAESQRFRSYLNNARQFNSYKEDTDSNWFMNKMRNLYSNFKSLHPEDQNNPQLMDQTTEDVLYYTTPETLKGLLARKNNTQLNNYV